MNKVILVGRLTKDPELRNTASGIAVCSFTVACDRRYAKQGEERQADFINCVAWRQTGEFVSRYFTKGTRIALDGSIQTRSWDDNEGKRRYATEVMVDNVEFAQSKNEAGAASYNQPSATPNSAHQNPTKPSGDIDGFMPIDEEDLPF